MSLTELSKRVTSSFLKCSRSEASKLLHTQKIAGRTKPAIWVYTFGNGGSVTESSEIASYESASRCLEHKDTMVA